MASISDTLGKSFSPDDPAVGEGLVEGLRAGVITEVGRVHRPEQADILAERHGLSGREVERRIPVQQAVQGEQRLGAGGVQFGQVHQGGPAQRPRDVTVLPTTLGASEAVPVELDRADQGDVPHLSRQRYPVVGQAQPGGELLDVVVLAGSHVAAHREVERDRALRLLPPDLLHLREPVEHADVDIVRVRLRNLVDALLVVADPPPGYDDRLQSDGPTFSGRVGEGDCGGAVRHCAGPLP